MMGNSIGYICDSSYLPCYIDIMEEICQEMINTCFQKLKKHLEMLHISLLEDVRFVMIKAVGAMKHYHGRW